MRVRRHRMAPGNDFLAAQQTAAPHDPSSLVGLSVAVIRFVVSLLYITLGLVCGGSHNDGLNKPGRCAVCAVSLFSIALLFTQRLQMLANEARVQLRAIFSH